MGRPKAIDTKVVLSLYLPVKDVKAWRRRAKREGIKLPDMVLKAMKRGKPGRKAGGKNSPKTRSKK